MFNQWCVIDAEMHTPTYYLRTQARAVRSFEMIRIGISDQWSVSTRIMVDRINDESFVQSEFIGSFDLPWSECQKERTLGLRFSAEFM